MPHRSCQVDVLGEEMRPDKLTIHDLFQKERRYVVPLYQRPYVWSQDEQWSPLWDDIERQVRQPQKQRKVS